MTQQPKTGRAALWILPMVLVPGAFVASLPWLKTMDDVAVQLAAAATAIFVMSYAMVFAVRSHRSLDEVQKAGAGFAMHWGVPAGQTAFVLLMLLPPFQDLAIAFVTSLAGDPGTTVSREVVMLAMTIGLCGVVLLQGIGTIVLSAIWWARNR